MNRSLVAPLAGVLILAVFAGCIGDDIQEDHRGDADRNVREPRLSDDLFGWVVDTSFTPVPQVNMSLIGAPGAANDTATNATGFFSFPTLPRGEELTVIAQHEDYITNPKKIRLPTEGAMRLNFTLEPRPVLEPWDEVLDFNGLLACQAVVEYDEGHMAAGTAGQPLPLAAGGPDAGLRGQGGDAGAQKAAGEGERIKVDCGSMDPNNADTWEFSVGSNLAGVVVEVSWESDSPYAENFRLTLESDGHGGDNSTLARVVGQNVLSAQVNQHQAERYYQDGGIIRAMVEVDPNVDEEETGTGVAFAYQQEFTIHATAFYVTPPPSTYSFHSS